MIIRSYCSNLKTTFFPFMYDLLIFVDNRHDSWVHIFLCQKTFEAIILWYGLYQHKLGQFCMMFSDIHFFKTVIPSTQVTFRPPPQKGCRHEIKRYLGMERYLRMKRHFSKVGLFRMKRSQRMGRHLSTEHQPGMESRYRTKCHPSMECHRRKEL
jgi:hypothetical protein